MFLITGSLNLFFLLNPLYFFRSAGKVTQQIRKKGGLKQSKMDLVMCLKSWENHRILSALKSGESEYTYALLFQNGENETDTKE